MEIAGVCRGAMGIAGGDLALKVRSCPPVSLVPPGQTGVARGRGLSMRSFRYGRPRVPAIPAEDGRSGWWRFPALFRNAA